MVVVKFISTLGSGFPRAIKVPLFFLISMSLLESGFCCFGGGRPSTRSSDGTNEKSVSSFQEEYRKKLGNCNTKFVKLLVSNPTKAAQELVQSWHTLVADSYNRTLARSGYYDLKRGSWDRLSIKGDTDSKFEKFRKENKDGRSCLDNVPPDDEENQVCDKAWDHAKVNKIISKNIGYRCKSGKCHFHHKQLEFVCGSTSLQAMTGLFVAALFFLGLYSIQEIP